VAAEQLAQLSQLERKALSTGLRKIVLAAD